MTQKARVLRALNLEGSICSMAPLDWSPRIYRVAARVLELRDEGHEIITHTKCKRHYEPQHHAMYELVGADQGALF